MLIENEKSYKINGETLHIIPSMYTQYLDGKHMVTIMKSDIIKTAKGLKLIVLTCENEDGVIDDFTIFVDYKYTGLFAKLLRCIFEGEIEELDVQDLVGAQIEIDLLTSGRYQNIVGIEEI